MRIAIIADDLTGANDSGVQFARKGLKASVLFNMNSDESDDDVVIIDTDSRSSSKLEAYSKVKTAVEYLYAQQFDLIYKKIDSTLRGNIGAEFDAIYDVYKPDFIICTPAYPEYKREVKNGFIYLGDTLLHETEFALDPKTPITESYIPKLIEEQSGRMVGIITLDDMENGRQHLLHKLEQYKESGRVYIVFDAVTGSHLQQIVDLFVDLPYRVIWSGSAGLAGYLTTEQHQRKVSLTKSDEPVLIVVGSVNQKTRNQLNLILSRPDVLGVMLQAHLVVAEQPIREHEEASVYKEAARGLAQKLHIVLYSSGEPSDVTQALDMGVRYGLNGTEVSDTISKVLGRIGAGLLRNFSVNRLILTGGDTAKQVCQYANMKKFELIDEVETGVPIGIFTGESKVYGVTKAGGFGSDQVLVHSLRILQGEEMICAQ